MKKTVLVILCFMVLLTGCMQVTEDKASLPQDDVLQEVSVYNTKLINMDVEHMLAECDLAAEEKVFDTWENQVYSSYISYTRDGVEARFGYDQDGGLQSFLYYLEEFVEVGGVVSYYPERNQTGAERISALEKETAVHEAEELLSALGLSSVQLGVCVAIDKDYINQSWKENDVQREATDADEAYYMSFYMTTLDGSCVFNRVISDGDSDASGLPPVILLLWGSQGLREIRISNIREMEVKETRMMEYGREAAGRKAEIAFGQPLEELTGISQTLCYIAHPVNVTAQGKNIHADMEYRPVWLFDSSDPLQECVAVDVLTGEVYTS